MNTGSRFFVRILLPSLSAVLCFMIAIFLFVIPNYRESLMDGKRETIRELTNTAWSVMQKKDHAVDEHYRLREAKNEAKKIIGDMRYGDELKDYFWINDTTPKMIMHPYRPYMEGMDLSDYRDLKGKNFFVDIVNITNEFGSGYIEYNWQWKDDSLTVVPKLSYVKSYEPWGWIVGTGIYIEDVSHEITKLTKWVVWISVLITIIIAAIIIYLARRNYIAEKERQAAQERLRDSMERYKKLVEASTDGVLMIIENEIVYCNPYLLNLLEYSQEDFDQKNSKFYDTLNSFIYLDSEEESENSGQSEVSVEQKVKKKNGDYVNVVINRSKFEIEGKHGYIFTVKDVSKNIDFNRDLDLDIKKFKSIAGIMNLGIFRCTLGRKAQFVEINSKALELLGYSSEKDLKETLVQELFYINTEKKEVIRAINEGKHIKDRLLRLRRADGTILPAMVTLFPVNDANGKTVFCDGIIIDAYDHLSRDVAFEKNPTVLHLSASVLLQPVKDFIIAAPHCDMNTSIATASKLLTKSGADILVIMNDNNSMIGLLTHSDISRRVVAAESNLSLPVSEIMSAPVISVSDDDMVMDAFTMMVQHKVSYIVVKQKDNLKPYYISLLKLSELRKDTPEYLINSIQKADSIYEISNTVELLPRLIRNLVDTGTGASTTSKLISKISDTSTEKIIEDAIKEIGVPPAPFVFMALGSEGRKEQTLATDQDNAIVYKTDRGTNNDSIQEYFITLGSKVCNALNKVGYPLCKGGVMAMNKEWCMEVSEWEKTISEWINRPNPQEVLNTSIFFDFRPVYGDFELANALQHFCQKELKDKSVYFYNLAQSTVNLKPPSVDSSKQDDLYDIKMPILAIISIARLWSLKYGVSERNTKERFFVLNSADVISNKLMHDFTEALSFLMLLRVKNQLKQIEENKPVNNKINLNDLSDIEKIMLKKIINTISDHQNHLSMEFRLM